MKTQILIITALFTFGFTQAQDLFPSEIPSVILNNFNLQHPKAKDVEWKKKGANYQVEFDINWTKDHEIWYTATGEIIKHKEDISKKDVSAKVKNTIDSDFKGYYISDIERITTGDKIIYKMDLNSLLKENWEIVMNDNGDILSKKRD